MRRTYLFLWLLPVSTVLALQPDTAMLRRVFEEALSRRQKEFGAQDARTAQATRDLGLFLQQNGETVPARRVLADTVRIDEGAFGPNATQTLEDVAALAAVSPPIEAERLLRRASEATDPLVAGPALSTLGAMHKSAGDRAGAAQFLRQAVTKAEMVDGKEGATVALILNALALVVQPKEAIPSLERALAIERRQYGDRDPATASTRVDLAASLLAAGRSEDSVRVGRDALAACEAAFGQGHPQTAAAAGGLASALRARGDRSAAEPLYRQALAIDRQVLGARHVQTLRDARNLAALLRETGREREAAALEQQFKAVSH